MIKAVLFDLDGTFADTAPDLAYALNEVRQERQLPPLPIEAVRVETSNGANALIKLGFGIARDHPDFSTLRERLLFIYRNNIARHTTLFEGMSDLLDVLDQQNYAWGIVTNKPEYLTMPLLEQLGLTQRSGCIVSGDTTAYSKPHPEPLLYASKLLEKEPHQCMYVGDAKRDIEAGIRAGMKTLVATFGYLSPSDEPDQWGADGAVDHPLEILKWI